jgi:tetratricopeptide (TPR) repeat protein
MQLARPLAVFTCLIWLLGSDGQIQAQQDVLAPPSDLFGTENTSPPRDDSATEPQAGNDAFGAAPGGDVAGDGQYLTNDQQVEAAYNQGQQLVEQGDYEGAIKQFTVAVTLNPRHVPSLLAMGRAQKELGYDDLAIQWLNQAANNARLNPEAYAEALLERGNVYLDSERFAQAVEDFRQILQLNPADPEYSYKLGLALAEQGYASVTGAARRDALGQAVENLDRAIELKPSYAEAYYERGTALLQLGELDDAIDDLEESVRLDDTKPDVVAQVGIARLQRATREADSRNADQEQIVGDFQRAIDALGRYFELAPEPQPDRRRGEDDEGPEIQPENAYVFRAIAFIGLGDELGQDDSYYQKAVEDCNRAIALEPENPLAYFERGVAERMMGSLDEALRSLTESIQLNPGNTEAYLRRGIVWFRQGDFRLALSDFESAIGFNRDPRASFWAGLSHAMLGDYRAAIDQYSEALSGRTRFPLASLNRGIAYLKLGRYRRALEDFNDVLRQDHDNDQARSYRQLATRMLAERGD